MKPEISVIVCTHNGAKYLDRAIKSIVNQSLSREKYEILIIDNDSSDSSREIAISKESTFPQFRYVFEPRLGLSYARNRGIIEASSPFVAFLDDDAYACHEWLERVLDSFRHQSPIPHAVGGKIMLEWESRRPEWLPESALRSLTFIDYSPVPRYLDFSKLEYPFGANMAFKKDTLIELGMFDVRLGRIGNKLLSNEEKSLFFKLAEANLKVYYDPRALVVHQVKSERISRRFLIERQYWQGISDVLWFATHPAKASARKWARQYLKEFFEQVLRLFRFTRLTQAEKVKHLSAAAYSLGCFYEELKLYCLGKT